MLIKNLGPLKDAELNLGNITVLLGPPNAGKSYTLRALYAQLLMLDEIGREYVVKNAVEALGLDHIDNFVRYIAPETLIIAVALYEYKQSSEKHIDIDNMLAYISPYLREKIGIEKIHIEPENNKTTVFVQTSERVNISDLVNLVNEKLKSASQELIPLKDNTKIEIPEYPIPEISSVLYEIFKAPFEVERSVNEMGVNAILKLSSKPEKRGILKITTNLTVHLELDSSIGNLIRRDLESVKKKITLTPTDEEYVRLLSKMILESRTRFFSRSEWRIRMIFRELSKLISELITYFANTISEQLQSIYKEVFNLQSAIFIPFGRSPFMYQLDKISNEPYLWHEIREIYGDNFPFYSYIYHLIKGRSQLLSNKVSKELVRIFNPVLQGELTIDTTTKRLRYKKWNTVDVPISQASALAGEISGILLPVLSVPPSSYLIIEEPEAQLHYSAQILMALVLAGLSTKFNHKITFSTHSDMLVITLAYLKELDYDKKAIIGLIQELLKAQEIKAPKKELTPLAEAVSQAKKLDIKFYYYEPKSDGTVKILEKPAREILKEVPGMTVVTDILASWALSL